MSFNEKLSRMRMKDMDISLQNSRISFNARKQTNELPTPLKPVDEELLREYNKQFETPSKKLVFDIKDIPELENESSLELYNTYDESQLKQIRLKMNELSRRIEYLQKNIKAIQAQEVALKIAYNKNEITQGTYLNSNYDLEQEKNNLLDELKQYEYEIKRYNEAIDLNNERITSNIAKKVNLKESNDLKLKTYGEELSFLNSGDMNMKRKENETQEQYIERLQRNAELETIDTKLVNARNLTILNLRQKMKELIRDPVLIEQVINSLDGGNYDNVERRSEILKKWALFKKKFLELYGYNNEYVKLNDIMEFVDNFFNPSVKYVEEQLQEPIYNKGEVPQLLASKYKHNIIIPKKTNEGLVLHNTDRNKDVVLLPARKIDGGLITLFSIDGTEGSYKQINTDTHIIEQILQCNKNDIKFLFGSNNPEKVAEKLVNTYNIPVVNPSITLPIQKEGQKRTPKHIYGYGLHNEDLPKFANFGKILINLHKLYYDNILAPRYKTNQFAVHGFNNMKVSDKLVHIIMNLLEKINPTHSDLNMLSNNERMVYDRLLHLGGFHKSIPNTEDKTITDYKKRLKLLEAEINIGNTNPEIKKEIYTIIHSLCNFGVITSNQLKQYIKQL